VGDSYAQLWFEGHKENCNIKMQNSNYKGECVLYKDIKTNVITEKPNKFGVLFDNQTGTVYFGKWVDSTPESYLDSNNAVYFTPENFLIESELSFDEELKLLNNLFIKNNKPPPIIFYDKYWEFAPEIKKHIIEFVNNKKNNQKNSIDFKKMMNLKIANLIAYEEQYLNKKLMVSFSRNELKFKKIEKGTRTVYGDRSPSYSECMRTRLYNRISKEWGSCAEIQVPYYNLFFEYPVEKLQIICIDIEKEYFEGISKLSTGDSVYIDKSIFSGFSERGEIYLKSCRGGK